MFNGVYHVLGGVLAPMEGVGPGDLRIAELMARLGREDVTEVVLAMNPNIEGESHGRLPRAAHQALGREGDAPG